MSKPIGLTAVIALNPGGEKRFIELFEKCAAYSKANEPFVWTYELQRAKVDPRGEVTHLVIKEVYENQEMLKKHGAGQPVRNLVKGIQSEGLVKETVIYYHDQKPDAGFSARL